MYIVSKLKIRIYSVIPILLSLICAITAENALPIFTAAAAPRQHLGNNFLWGVATSGFQSEGEPQPSNWTEYIRKNNLELIGKSVDFLHRYREDISNAAAMGIKVFRIGTEWSRLEPSRGHWNDSAWNFYDNVLKTITAAGMRPMITLDHWVYPKWEYDVGGWTNPRMVNDWVNYARHVVDRAVAYHPLWITFNEPEFYMLHEMTYGPVGFFQLDDMVNALTRAHKQIYAYIHHADPHAMVSSNSAFVTSPERPFPGIIDHIADSIDFVGFDYYYSTQNSPGIVQNILKGNDWEIPVQPEGLYYTARYYSQRFPRKPLYVVENGTATNNAAPNADGYSSSDALQDEVYWIQRANADGMHIIGYNYWSITDNYEWGTFNPRFGIYTVDARQDPALIRHPTPLVDTYKKIIAQGGDTPNYTLIRGLSHCLPTILSWGCYHPAAV